MNIYRVDAGYLYYIYNGNKPPTDWVRDTDNDMDYSQACANALIVAQNREQARQIFVDHWSEIGFVFDTDEKISIRKIGEHNYGIGILEIAKSRDDLFIAPPSDLSDIPF